ncbi:MAG TPA: hypothetical protein VHN99_09440, partial [Deinococcales bacterium]|nr:hypothetical protein [Deinococcales bacterium]
PGPGGSSWYTPLAVGVPAVVASGSGSVWLGLQYHLVVSRADAAGAVAAPDLQVSFDVQAGS